ncbi:MAG: LutB/LldF family L-lactate oxidation iron-sulfur protein [Anaerolineae bacterium]
MAEHGYPSQPFDERVRDALAKPSLGQALARATQRFYFGRILTWQGLGDYQTARHTARAARRRAVDHLDETLQRLADNVAANGGHVHWAADAAEANAIVLDICRAANARVVTKSKSMLTEEIALNDALEAAGITVVETDLGEWIIQLAGETPSHIIAPAIHKTKAEVAELFSRVLGRPVSPDASIPELTRIAREQLRQRFLDADVGISGVNFAIAESGTVSIVTNEGNGRYVTGLPRVHIAMMGAEKVIGTWEEWAATLKMLTRSATGQLISSYVSTVSGPRRPDDADGPEEFHLVILDNGRSRILGTTFRESLLCIRCAACLNACPVYHEIGGHAYGGVYTGPIGAVLSPLLFDFDRFKELPHASSLCGACRDACPVEIDLPRMLVELRRIEAEGEAGERPRAPWTERALFALYRLGAQTPALYNLAAWGRAILKPLAKGEQISDAPLPVLDGWTKYRDFPLPAAEPFHARWERLAREPDGGRERRDAGAMEM